MTTVIDLAKQFAPFPFGRYEEHGPHSGARFREEFLLPLLRRGESVVVDLSNARGLAPSFLEEAFGGLVRAGFTPTQLDELIEIRSETDPSLTVEIKTYILNAAHAGGAPH